MMSQSTEQSLFVDVESYLKTWKPQPLDQARPLPAQLYVSEQIYRLEQERFFGKCWLYVGHLSQLPSPGSFFTTTIAEQPLLIVRDQDGNLCSFFNVCPHRAGPVALGSGKCNRLVCAYHAWTFDLKGELKAAPYMDSVQDFKLTDYQLQQIQIDTWGPFIFVNFDPVCKPLTAQLGDLPELLKRYDFASLVPAYQTDYYINANWKLYFENSAESYHASSVHPSLELFRNVQDIEVNVQPQYYMEYLPFLSNTKELDGRLKPDLVIESLNQNERHGTSVLLMWPNFIMILCPNFVIARIVDPQGLSKTRVQFNWFVPNTNTARSPENVDALVTFYDKIVKEDIPMLNHLQKGMQSLKYMPAHLSPILEAGIHQFQQSLMKYIC